MSESISQIFYSLSKPGGMSGDSKNLKMDIEISTALVFNASSVACRTKQKQNQIEDRSASWKKICTFD